MKLRALFRLRAVFTALVAIFALVVVTSGIARAATPLVLATDSYFFVGGHYEQVSGGQVIVGQMYVRAMIPAQVTHRYPIVMIHGGGQTGTNFTGTPDGREGWAQFFLRQGYIVYVVDQVGRAKSSYGMDVYGPYTGTAQALTIEQRFTAVERFNLWPQAHLHTQWPGSGPLKGQPGDPIFDQFLASQVPGIANANEQEILDKSAGGALLDKIGPAILLTHSQSGPYGWQIADARPNLVKGILAIEPGGGPFYDSPVLGGALSRPWGITATAITYSPAVTDPSQLAKVQQSAPDAPGLVACWMQAAPARQLPTLKGKAILIITSEASYHAQYDHCTSKYLTQADVAHTYIRLPDVGIHGNGHMMMIELNNLQIASLLASYLQSKGL